MRKDHLSARLFTALALALTFAACGREPGRGRGGKGVLLIVIDELRADHVGAYGHTRATTPNLDGLVSEGVWFSNVFSAAPDTIPSHASILTGTDPRLAQRTIDKKTSGHGSLMKEWFIPDDVPRVAREFLIEGYRTAAFVDHPWISPVYGFSAGFETFRGFREGGVDTPPDFGIKAVGGRLTRWLAQLPKDQNWFAYLTAGDLERTWSIPDPHWDTYFEPDPARDQLPPISSEERAFFAVPRSRWPETLLSYGEYEARYDGALGKLDAELHQLFAHLEAMGRWEETTICVIGSYGLGFGESGLIIDHGTLSDVDLHVPMILRPAKGRGLQGGREIDSLTSLLDVAPTLLELSDIEPPMWMHGVSQAPVLRGETDSVREFVFSAGGIQRGFGVRDHRYSFQEYEPGSLRPTSLLRSWSGESNPSHLGVRQHLRDRKAQSDPGNLQASVSAPQVGEVLRAAGESWYQAMDLAQKHLQREPWSGLEIKLEELQDLERRALIPPLERELPE
jgi:arylsulfatase A-like enzyme